MDRKSPKKVKPYRFTYKALKTDEEGNNLIPKAKGNIPKLAVLLGLLSPQYFNIYNKCDGKKTVMNLSEELNIEILTMRQNMDKLLKNGLISFQNT